MIDRDSGELREPDQRLLVLTREFTTAALLGEIQIAERLTRNDHRDSEEAPHRGMSSGKPIRPRVIPHVRDTQRRGIADQLAEHTVPRRQRPDLTARRRVNTCRDEPRQRRPGLIKNSDRGISSSGQLPSRLKNTLQHTLEVQIAKHTARDVKHTTRRRLHTALSGSPTVNHPQSHPRYLSAPAPTEWRRWAGR